MPPIQIGIDIATSLSVLGVAGAFIKTQIRQAKNLRASALRQQRIDRMSGILLDFSKILEDGDEIVQRVRRAQAGRVETIDVDDYTGFCIRIESYIRIKTACLFSVWATDAEMNSIKELEELVRTWNSDFVRAAIERGNGNPVEVPSFDKLIDNLTEKVTKFSALFRQEIEKIVA